MTRTTVAAAALILGLGVGATFPDPLGDVRGGAGPDLASVSVSHTATTVTFRLRFAKAPPLGASVREKWVEMLIVGIDVPPRGLRRTARGWTGLDYYVGMHGVDTTAVLVRASPAPPTGSTPVARLRVAVSGRTLGFTLRRSSIGNPAWLEFVVAAGRETSDPAAGGGSDEAPGRGVFHVRLG